MMRTNIWIMVGLFALGMNVVEAGLAGSLESANASWAIPYGQEFWRQAPTSKTTEVKDQESATALAKSGVNIGELMERVSCSFRTNEKDKVLAAEGQTYRAVVQGNGMTFSPFLPAKSNGVEKVSEEATCPRGTLRSVKRDTVRKKFSRRGAETQSRRDVVRSGCFLRDPCVFARDDLLFSERLPETQLEKKQRERPDPTTRSSSDPNTVARFHTVRVTIGDNVLYDVASAPAKVEESTVGNTIQRLLNAEAGLVEHWQTRREGMEIAWVLQQPPAGGRPLVIEMNVSGLDLVGTTANAVHYGNERVGRARVSGATAVDAAGNRFELAMRSEGSRIVYELPEKFLASATYPMAVDPIISAEFGMDNPIYVPAVGNQGAPSLAWNGSHFLVVWHDDRRGSLWDIYGTRVNRSGFVLDPAGIAICTATNQQGDPSVAWDGNNFLVVWEDFRSLLSFDIYGARVSSAGAVLDPDGIAICTAASGQGNASVAWNGNHFLVVWMDYRNGTHSDIYGTRVSSAGTVVNPTGIAICTAANDQLQPSVAWGGSNFLVVWQDERNVLNSDIYGTLVSSFGTVLDPAGIAICTTVRGQYGPEVAWNGSHFLVVWYDNSTGGWHINGALVSSSGAVLTGIAISTAASVQYAPSVAWNGINFLVVWIDARSGSDYYDISGARVSSTGAVLDPAGIDICTTASEQGGPSVSWDGNNFLVVWDDCCSGSNDGIYGARVSSNGVVLDSSGIIISTESVNEQHRPAVAWNGTNYLVVWTDNRESNWDIYGVRVNSAGTVLDPDGIAISTATTLQMEPSVASDGNNFLVVWDKYNSESLALLDIYGARVSSAGELLDPSEIAICTASRGQQSASVAWNGSHFLVVWMDYRNGLHYDIYGARVSSAGAVLDPAGIVICTAAGDQLSPSLAWNGSRFLVGWEDYRSGSNYDIYGTRLSSVGAVLDPAGIPISTAAGAQRNPSIVWNGSDFIVVWDDFRGGSNYDVYGTRVNASGTVLDPPGIAICTATGDQENPSIVWNGSHFLVVWEDLRSGFSYDIYGARISSAGVVLDFAGIPVNSNAGDQLFPVVAVGSNGQSFVACEGWMYGTTRTVGVMVQETESTVTVVASDPTAAEPGVGYGTGTFTFRRTVPLTAALTANFSVGGTATAGSDYTSLETTVSFAAGSATATKTVSVIDDSLVEGDETVVVTLASGTGYTVGSSSNATVTIKDDDSSTSEIIVDNADVTGLTTGGTWTGSTSTPGYWRTNYIHDGDTGKGTKSVMFRPTLPSDGNYEVSVWYTAGSNRATNVPMDIVYSGGTRTVLVNERTNGSKWVVLGTNSFTAGTSGYVKIRTDNTASGYVIADAVKFKKVDAIPPNPMLMISPTNLTTSCVQYGYEPVSQSFEVWNSGGGTLIYSVVDNAPWLSCAPTNGTSMGEHDSITLNYSATGLATGTYHATVMVMAPSASHSPQTLAVTLNIKRPAEIIVDNGDGQERVQLEGTWTPSTSSPEYWKTNYLHDGNTGKGTKSVTFRPDLPEAGDYEVWLWYTAAPNRATNVPIELVMPGVTSLFGVVNQRTNGGRWNLLGSGGFAAGMNNGVRIRTDGTTSGYVIADAVRFRQVSGPALSITPTNLRASCAQGSNPNHQSFEVWNSGGAIMGYSISDDVTWLSCSPTNGTSTGEHDSIIVNYNTAGLATGTYYATVMVIADSMYHSPQTVTVTLTVNPSPSYEVIVDNADAIGVAKMGTWTDSTSSSNYWRTNYIHDGNTGKGTKSVTFRPTLTQAGMYEVSVWYTAGSNRATNIPMDIVYWGGTRTVMLNERLKGSQWVVLGTNLFALGTNSYVKIRTDNTSSGYVIADAIKFRKVSAVSSVSAWGDNGAGQCDVPVFLSNVVAIAAAWHHSLALRKEGTVVAWGSSYYGQCDVPVGLSNAIAIAAGGYGHSLALSANGTVVAWGYNLHGQCNVPVGLSNVVAIAAGQYHSLALRANGTVVAWGSNDRGQLMVPATLSNVVAIAAGAFFSLALRQNGTVVAWGSNSYGEGNVPAGLSNAVAIAGGYWHSLALRRDGTVIAWGANNYGQCNVPMGLSNAVAVAAGGFHSLVARADGTVLAWGRNLYGECNVPVGLSNIVGVAGGYAHSLTLPDWLQSGAVIVDNGDSPARIQIEGGWMLSTSTPGFWSGNYLHDGNTDKGTKWVTFRSNLPLAGDYEVAVWYTAGPNRATNVPMDIVYSGGTRTVLVNERANGSQWVVLGTNSFAAGTSGYVKIRTDNTASGYVIADAVRFKSAGAP